MYLYFEEVSQVTSKKKTLVKHCVGEHEAEEIVRIEQTQTRYVIHPSEVTTSSLYRAFARHAPQEMEGK